ncbi:MAG TPA: hypothetical protein VFZ61_19510 [Polyangiales bacterium]
MRVFTILLLSFAIPPIARAQTTFFQVPSADVPSRGQARAQLQGMGTTYAEFEGMLVMGLGHQWELGFTFYNLAFDLTRTTLRARQNHEDSAEPVAPTGLASAQKLVELTQLMGIAFGVQAGADLIEPRRAHFVGRAYALLALDFERWGRCTAGPYVATQTFLGEHQRGGAFVGCELELMRDVFGLEADWDLGAHALGAASVGPRFHLGEHSVIAAGVRIPNAWGSATWGGLVQLELTYPGRQD